MASAAPPPARLGAPSPEYMAICQKECDQKKAKPAAALKTASAAVGGPYGGGASVRSKRPRSSEDTPAEAPSAKARFGVKYHSVARDDMNVSIMEFLASAGRRGRDGGDRCRAWALETGSGVDQSFT